MLTRYTQNDLTWIDLVAPSPEEVRLVMHEFGFNPTIGQELLSVSIKSKAERYDDSLYLVLHFPMLHGSRMRRVMKEVDIVIGKEYLITARYEDVAALSNFAKAFEVESVLAPDGRVHGGHLFAVIMRNLYDALLSESDEIHAELLNIEERLFDGDEKHLVMEISEVGRVIYDFRQGLLPHREVFKSIEAPLTHLFGHEYASYLREVSAEYERVLDEAEGLRDSMIELRQTNNSMLSAKQNEVMKLFSILAFVFVPASLIMTLYQMGLPGTPFEGHVNFWAVFGSLGALTLIFIVYCERKGWL